MDWSGANLSFWLITIVVLVSAYYAAFAESILKAAFSLFFTLFGMAGYYVLLGSDFLAVTQVIIYVGGILVLIMFGVLLTNRAFPAAGNVSLRQSLGLALPGLLLLAVLVRVIFSKSWHTGGEIIEPGQSLSVLGELLLGKYLPALEIAGLTLLLCLIGAAWLVRRRER